MVNSDTFFSSKYGNIVTFFWLTQTYTDFFFFLSWWCEKLKFTKKKHWVVEEGVVVLLWLAHPCPSSNKLISKKQRKKTALNLDDSHHLLLYSPCGMIEQVGRFLHHICSSGRSDHTHKRKFALLSWNCMDCCKFLVLNDLRNSCPGIVWIVASFLT